MEELAQIEYIGTGTEPGHEDEQVYSWVRAGAVVRPIEFMQSKHPESGKYICTQEADTLEGVVSAIINLPRGEAAPSLTTKPWLNSVLVNKSDINGCDYRGNYLIWSKPEEVNVALLPELDPIYGIAHLA